MSLDFFAGCVGGAAGVIVGHPLDTVKVRLQIQSAENAKYKGTFDCLRTTVRQEGARGLYKGISSPLFGVAGVNALIFGVYGSLRPYVHGNPGQDRLWAHFLAGSISGAVQSFIASPMELVKTRMQLNDCVEPTSTTGTSSNKAPSSLEVLKKIYRSEGGLFRGVFKGWCVTLAREIPGFGTYFATYEALTTKSGREVGTFGMMMAGGLAGVASWIVTFPIDVVKTRLQSDVNGKYSGAIDCLKKTYKAEGYSAFSRGLVSTVIRAFPTNAATFTVVTWIMRWAENNKIDTMGDGREYIVDILNDERARIQETFDALRLPLPHYLQSSYLIPTGSSLGSSCAKIIAKYADNTKDYFRFMETFADYEDGPIRERFSKAIQNDLAQEKSEAHRRFDALVFDMTPRLQEAQDPLVETRSSGTSLDKDKETLGTEDFQGSVIVMDDGSSRTMHQLKKLTSPADLSFRLRTFLLQFLNKVLPTIKLCSCWDDANCVCFS